MFDIKAQSIDLGRCLHISQGVLHHLWQACPCLMTKISLLHSQFLEMSITAHLTSLLLVRHPIMTCQMATGPTLNLFLISLHLICWIFNMMSHSSPQIWSRNKTYLTIPPCPSQCHLSFSLCHCWGGTKTQCYMIPSWCRFGLLMSRFCNCFCCTVVPVLKMFWFCYLWCPPCTVVLFLWMFTNFLVLLFMMHSLHCLDEICFSIQKELHWLS